MSTNGRSMNVLEFDSVSNGVEVGSPESFDSSGGKNGLQHQKAVEQRENLKDKVNSQRHQNKINSSTESNISKLGILNDENVLNSCLQYPRSDLLGLENSDCFLDSDSDPFLNQGLGNRVEKPVYKLMSRINEKLSLNLQRNKRPKTRPSTDKLKPQNRTSSKNLKSTKIKKSSKHRKQKRSQEIHLNYKVFIKVNKFTKYFYGIETLPEKPILERMFGNLSVNDRTLLHAFVRKNHSKSVRIKDNFDFKLFYEFMVTETSESTRKMKKIECIRLVLKEFYKFMNEVENCSCDQTCQWSGLKSLYNKKWTRKFFEEQKKMKFENENGSEDDKLFNSILEKKFEEKLESQERNQISEIYEKILPEMHTIKPTFGNYACVTNHGFIAAHNSFQFSNILTFKEQKSQDDQLSENTKKESNKTLQSNPKNTAMNRDIEDVVIKNCLNWDRVLEVELLNGFHAEKSPNGDTQ